MLDPILNINPNERYKSGSKSQQNFYSIQKNTEEKNHPRDSALFSPLARLLSKINWQIINVSYPTRDQIRLNFLKDDLEFLTLIDFNTLYTENYHEFLISKKGIIQDKDFEYKVGLKVQKETITTLDKIIPLEIENIQELFSRILYLDYAENEENNYTDQLLFSELLFEVEDQINSELNLILTAIYTFISIQQKSKIRNNFTLNTDQNNPIIIQRVSIIGQ